jgi:phosphopantothenate-cysteine ligase/phosphopantothenoylcysteine decarboxylase/phosphopantothenate--cysteine ligase
MKILVTAGSTQMPIDKVRCITNIFKGRTGTNIAWEAAKKHQVTLIGNSSSQDMINTLQEKEGCRNIIIHKYKTFDHLERLMEREITTGEYDVVIHSAAVSDYKVGIATYEWDDFEWWASCASSVEVDKEGKIPSGKYLLMGLIPTKKLIDQIRNPWGFKGKLVKFKLQVGISDEELLEIAKRSRATSDADYIVANCLEWSQEKAYIIDQYDVVNGTSREDLPRFLLEKLENQPKIVSKKAIDINPYFHSVYCTLDGVEKPFCNDIVARRWNDNGKITFMLETHNFLTDIDPEDEIRIVEEKPGQYYIDKEEEEIEEFLSNRPKSTTPA